MQVIDYPLVCNRIGKISQKLEGSDRVILPAHLKPQKTNIFGYYIFKITSDLSTQWTYCCVKEWTAGEHDCYLPTWMMNYLHIPDRCEAKFTFDNFNIKKAESLVLQPADEMFDSYYSLVDPLTIHRALDPYITLSNNSRITLHMDGQKFSVIVRLLCPEEKVRTTTKMHIVVAKNVYRKRGVEAVDESKKSDDEYPMASTVINRKPVEDNSRDMLNGLCHTCYRLQSECRCHEMKVDPKKEKRKMEEESRRIALEALEQRYCMNCFHLKEECICTASEIKAINARAERKKPLQTTQLDVEDEIADNTLKEDDYDIMEIVDREIKAEEQRGKEKESVEGQDASGHPTEVSTESKPSKEPEESEESEEVTDDVEAGCMKEEVKETQMKGGNEAETKEEGEGSKQDHAVFYYWPILPQEHCKRWEVDSAVMIPPPPPDVSELDQRQVTRKNAFLWSLFKRSNR